MAEGRVTPRQRTAVAARAGHCCEYCRSPERFAVQSFSVEHVQPASRQGTTTLDNLALSCQGCNNFKYNKVEGTDAASGEVVPLFHPRRDRWTDHFAWSADFTHVIGLTPTGRATVKELRLNRDGLVNFRRLLYAAGKHPPSEQG
jgi:hypothetical protein